MVSVRAKSESAYAMILDDCNIRAFLLLHFISHTRLCGAHNTRTRALQKPYYVRFFYTFNSAD